jgi:hypothetical protein
MARDRFRISNLGVILLILAYAAIVGLSVLIARAHSFYPHECCHDRDCWPMGEDADAREPEPKATPQGWLRHDGAVVAYAAARPSPDGRFHVCRHAGSATGSVIRPEGRPVCLFCPSTLILTLR